MVWKVVFYGRCNARTKPGMAAPICDVYNDGDFVEVFDFTESGNSKWLKIKGHDKDHAAVAWILAMDPFCHQDLLIRATNTEAKRAREVWGQRPRREFDRSPPRRKVEAPPTPAADGQGPATQPPPAPTH